METGNAGPKVKRTYVFEGQLDENGRLVQPRLEVEQAVLDLLGMIWVSGGIFRVVADRVKTGELPPDKAGRREPLAETVGVVIEAQLNMPLNDESITQLLLEHAYDDAIEEEQEPLADVFDRLNEQDAAERSEREADASSDGEEEQDDDEPGDEPETKET